jgi:hypothetical protein
MHCSPGFQAYRDLKALLPQAKQIDERHGAIPSYGTRSIHTMSKPTARIVLVSLIAVVLVAAAYLTVQGAFAKAESAGAQAHVVSGLQTNFNHDRSTPAELEALKIQTQQNFSDPGSGRHGGGCEDEMRTSPQD